MASKKMASQGLPKLTTELLQAEPELSQVNAGVDEKADLINLFISKGIEAVDIKNFEDIENAILVYTSNGQNYEVALRVNNALDNLLKVIYAKYNRLSWVEIMQLDVNTYFELAQQKNQIYLAE